MERKPWESHQKLDIGTVTLELANLSPSFLLSARVVGCLLGCWPRWLWSSWSWWLGVYAARLSVGPKGSHRTPDALLICALASLSVCVSWQGWHVCLGVEERRSGRCWLYFQKFLEKRHRLPLEGLPQRCGAQHLVGFLKEVRFKTSNAGHEAWRPGKADQTAHPPLQESCWFFLPAYRSWREVIHADRHYAALERNVFVTWGVQAPQALRAGMPGLVHLPSPGSKRAWQGWHEGVPGWTHTRGAVWGVCHPVPRTRLPECEVCTHSLPLTTGIVNPVYSQKQDGQGAA